MRACGFLVATALLAPGAASAQAPAAERKAVRSIDDLPRFSYPYRGRVADLLDRPELLVRRPGG